MRITLLGATGGTGKILLRRWLEAGHEITCLVRDPARLEEASRCRVVTGDARDEATMRQAVQGAAAVLTTLGAKSPFEKSDLLERAAPNIVVAMQQAGVRRLIVLGSGGWQPGAAARQSAIKRWVLDFGARTLLRYPIEAQRAQEAAIVPSPLDWTIVAPARLTNSAGRGLDRVRMSTESLPPRASQIAREDVAAIMLRALNDSAWIRQRVYCAW